MGKEQENNGQTDQESKGLFLRIGRHTFRADFMHHIEVDEIEDPLDGEAIYRLIINNREIIEFVNVSVRDKARDEIETMIIESGYEFNLIDNE